ncbi:MAG: hypothetical protein IPM96_02720 [Ignavibacteria bacterium]|nr:hypothetical protein [Ignavibacteria bacterium]
MKTPSEDLWKLIHSMNISEKGYFIKFARRHSHVSENNYVKLFEAVSRQKDGYDENEIKKIFKKEKFIKQLTSAKNYLYNMILKSLVSYNDEKSTESVLSNMKEHYTILFHKTLFTQAETILNRAKKLAAEEDKFAKLIDILKDQRNFDYRKIAEPDFDKYIDNCLKEELETIDKQKNIAEYNALYLRMSSLFKKTGIARNTKDKKMFEELARHPLMKNESAARSIRAKNLFYILNYLYYYCTGNHGKAFEFTVKRLELIGNNPLKTGGGKKEYLYALSDAIAMSYNLKKYDLCLSYLRKQREAGAAAVKTKNDIPNFPEMYIKSYSFEINIYIISGYFREGLKMVNEVTGWLDKYSGKLNRSEELKVIYSIAYLYFGAGEPEKSLNWLNKILNDRTEYRIDYKAFARLMNLIIHYELENYDLIDYEFKSVKRFLSKNDKLYEYENVTLSAIKNLAWISDNKEKKLFLEMLKKKLNDVIIKSGERKAAEYFDLISWIDSKLEGKSFSDVIKSRSKVKLSDLKLS